MAAVRGQYPVLRAGRQYLRPTSLFGAPFAPAGAGELLAWSRILSDEEALCVVNPHGTAARGGEVLVDAQLNPPGSALTVILNTAEAAGLATAAPAVGTVCPVLRRPSGEAYVSLAPLAPSESVVLINHAEVVHRLLTATRRRRCSASRGRTRTGRRPARWFRR